MIIIYLMKHYLLFLTILACMVACKPSIDSQLDKLEKAYAGENEKKSEKLWQKLWDRQNEMSLLQVERFVNLTEQYEPEWHYDDIDDGHEPNAIDAYFANCRNHSSSPSCSSQSYHQPTLYYYQCDWCGLVVKSNSTPSPGNGICKDRLGNGNHSYHAWHQLCKVGYKRIVRCSNCGLELQCERGVVEVQYGVCCDGKSQHHWENVY